ncbi:MAG: TatD family hydrolase [Deltaproteobacteria bacterium]|nr:MAG: TatD family hydrolase [Deltaproteobacteria bacterium]
METDSRVKATVIDTHAHLNEIEAISKALQRAKDSGISGIIAVGMEVASNCRTLDLAAGFPEFVYPAIGYHPWSITPATIDENLEFVEANLAGCIALGEVGLDYKAKAKKKIQWEVFSKLLSMAKRHHRPVIVHSRFSHSRSHQMVLNEGIEKAVFHWYSGPLETLEKITTDGYFVSATPALVYSSPHQQAMKTAPIERILVETDSPVEYQGKISEPAQLTTTLKELSRIKEMDTEEVRLITTENAKRFFGI